MDYANVPVLSAVYLEDSFVLEIVEEDGDLRFRIEAVLTESHPSYQPPRPGEQYCYADAWLVFTNTTAIQWVRRSTTSFTDASREADLGNIDDMTYSDGRWHFGGDWGEVDVHTTADPELRLIPTSPPEDDTRTA